MQRLPSNSKGEAKKSVESIFCAKALKSLKRDFSNPVLVSHLKMKPIFDHKYMGSINRIWEFDIIFELNFSKVTCDCDDYADSTINLLTFEN